MHWCCARGAFLLRRSHAAAAALTPSSTTAAAPFSSSLSRAPPVPSAQWPKTPEMATDGLDAAVFTPLWESALDAHARGQYIEALRQAKASVEMAAKGKRGSLGREHALRMGYHLSGLALLRLGRVNEAIQSLERAKEVAVRVSGAGAGDDAYTDLGGVLNDLGIAKALAGDGEGAQKNISRTLYMAQRAYRPDEDLVSAACSNLAEVMRARGKNGEGEWEEEESVEMAEKAARLTDKMERLSLLRKPAVTEEGSQSAGAKGGGGGASCPAPASSTTAAAAAAAAVAEAEEAEAITSISRQAGVWALPAELLNLHERSTRRRLILGRTLIRAHRGEEGAYYLFQALQDSRASRLRCNPILYAQCLAAVGSMHLTSLLHHGSLTDLSHLAAAGCREDNEMTWAAQGLLERALSVLAPCLGEGHPEAVVCKANLALLLPLARGVEVLEEAMEEVEKQQQVLQQQQQQQQQGTGKGRKKKGSEGEKSDISGAIEGVAAASIPPSSLPFPPTSELSLPTPAPAPAPAAAAAAAVTMPSLPASLARNKEALQALLIAVGHGQAHAHCAVDLVAAKKRRKGRREGGVVMTTTASSLASLGWKGGGGGGGAAVAVVVKEEVSLSSEVEEEGGGNDDEPPPVLEVLWTVQGVLGVGLKGWKAKKEEGDEKE